MLIKSTHRSSGSSDISQILNIYDSLRQPYGNEIMRWAHEMGELYELELSSGEEIAYGKLSEEQISAFREAVNKYWGWPIRGAGTIEEDSKRAQTMLEISGLLYA